MTLRFVIVALLLGGCIHDSLEQCGNLLCPSTSVCLAPDSCVPRDSIEVCAGQPDSTECHTLLIDTGVCANQLCAERGCGNGVRELPDEVCDDGNQAAGDSCAADCEALTTCPPAGKTPVFSNQFHQLELRNCQHYTTDITGMTAVASCSNKVMISDQGGALQPILQLANGLAPAVSPDGNAIWVERISPPVAAVSRRANGDWSLPQTVFTTTQSSIIPGRPSAEPNPHLFVSESGISFVLTEYSFDDTGTPTRIKAYTPTELGADRFVRGAHLTRDGLRMVFGGGTGGSSTVFYSDRASLADPMSAARPIFDMAPNNDAFLSDDCERLYFSALGASFYLRQIDQR